MASSFLAYITEMYGTLRNAANDERVKLLLFFFFLGGGGEGVVPGASSWQCPAEKIRNR